MANILFGRKDFGTSGNAMSKMYQLIRTLSQHQQIPTKEA